MFSNKAYNFLKPVALIVLPALSALYVALSAVWHLPFAEQIVGTIAAVNTFLGTALHISSSSYKLGGDGELVVDKSDPAKDVYSIQLATPVDELDKKDTISLKVTGADK